MSPGAAAAIARAREILAYRPDQARAWWNDRLTTDGRRAVMVRVGADSVDWAAGLAWDALPHHLQDAARLIHDKRAAAWARLRHEFGGRA